MKLSNPWLKVAAAVVLEPMWVLGMKHSDSWPMYLLTAASLILSFFMILKASDELALARPPRLLRTGCSMAKL